jgi:2-keto-3-deoxy-L-rhamnonate aldolase RhmA
MDTPFTWLIQRPPAPVGTIISTSSIEVADLLAGCGFDWLMLDTEHGSLTLSDVPGILAVVQGRVTALVRVQDDQEAGIKKALDAGADGIVVPQINTASAAARVVASAKYPPVGARSVGIARAHRYGERFSEYLAAANGATSVIVQVEHRDAVENIDDIVSVTGIDGIFIGPYDLSGSLGCIGEVSNPDVQAAIAATRTACGRVRMPVGIFGLGAEAGRALIDVGYDFVAVGIDLPLLGTAARQLLDAMRSE